MPGLGAVPSAPGHRASGFWYQRPLVTASSSHSILVVDPAPGTAEALRDAGWRVRTAALEDARASFEAHDVVLVEPTVSWEEVEGLMAVRRARAPRTAVVLRDVADPPWEAADALDVDDVLCRGATTAELLARLRRVIGRRALVEGLHRRESTARVLRELTQLLASSLDFGEILHTVVRRIAEVLQVARVSVVLAPERERPSLAYLVAASDDAVSINLEVDVDAHAALGTVLRTLSTVTLEGADAAVPLDGDPVVGAGPLTLLPIAIGDEALGVLLVRAEEGAAPLTAEELAFCRVVSQTTAIALRNARVMQSLRDQTQQVNFARYQAERRLRTLRRYADLFSGAADGLLALDGKGRVLFANPRAHEVVGLPEGDLEGTLLIHLVAEEDRASVARVWAEVTGGGGPVVVDVRVRAGDGPLRILSVSFSERTVDEGAVIVSFRDVSEERETARELSTTKDFLESVIAASVDGIVVADLEGKVLLFNPGAARIYGYGAHEVIDRMFVTDFYPESQAREIMRMLMSDRHGGEGRLSSIRFEGVAKDGTRVPVNLSAALIYGEDGAPMATVGIFRDLREKLAAEERLARAQEKLAVTERQAVVAELAGTAAHELNQPLTSVMGYGEFLQRKLEAGTPERHAADVVVAETERMADLVRKIGKITRYETKSYVGTQRILDLDRASSDIPPDGGAEPGGEEPA
jgi:PAS domain S-box-containing protein